jgi:hypothetical protein
MASSFNDEIEPGLEVRETGVFDKQQLTSIQVNSEEFRTFLVDLQERIDEISVALNQKESGIYAQTPFVNGNRYYPNPTVLALASPDTSQLFFRQAFHVEIDCGALPNAAPKTVPHGIIGIGNGYTPTRIYGASVNPSTNTWLPLPYVSTTGDAIEVYVDATNINIITQSDKTAFTTTRIYIEWLQD